MLTVIIVSAILFVVIIGLTIAHITGGYRIMPGNSDIDPDPTERDKHE